MRAVVRILTAFLILFPALWSVLPPVQIQFLDLLLYRRLGSLKLQCNVADAYTFVKHIFQFFDFFLIPVVSFPLKLCGTVSQSPDHFGFVVVIH
jgi:hypothetical protein